MASLLFLPGCVVKERVRLVPLPPKVTEKVYIIIPKPPQEQPSDETEKNKEAQNFA